MSFSEFFKVVVAILDDADVPYMITGSFALAYYAVPRATQDVDLVVDPTAPQIDELVDQLGAAGFYVDRDAAREALRTGGLFNAVDPEGGWKADFIIRKDRPFSVREFERRRPVTFLGLEVPLTRIEDLILAKLEWAAMGDSAMQRRDIEDLVRSSDEPVDIDYIEDWVDAVGVREEWVRLRKLIPGENDED